MTDSIITIKDFQKNNGLLDTLAWYLSASIGDFEKFGKFTQTSRGRLLYIDNGAPILSVAHLDTVQVPEFHGLFTASRKELGFGFTSLYEKEPDTNTQQSKWKIETKIKKPPKSTEEPVTIISASSLDDRLGAFAILELLPKLNIKTDILLTEGEESGNSTAKCFFDEVLKKKKVARYNWIVEFDRNGDDVVCYQYQTKALTDLLEKAGFLVGRGSYSDICDLWQLGVAAFNVGVGYHRNHRVNAYAVLEDFDRMMMTFAKFWKENKNNKLVSTAKSRFIQRTNYYSQPKNTRRYVDPRDFICKCGKKLYYLYKNDKKKCWDCHRQYWRGEKTGSIYEVTDLPNGAHTLTMFIDGDDLKKEKEKTKFRRCDFCATLINIDFLNKVPYLGKICDYCVKKYFSNCSDCGQLMIGEPKNHLCVSCEFELYMPKMCAYCQVTIMDDSEVLTDDGWLCEPCHEFALTNLTTSIETYCINCGAIWESDAITEGLCPDCNNWRGELLIT